jgi:hypothetical protein
MLLTDAAEMLTWPGGEADPSLKTRRISFRFVPNIGECITK